MGRAPCCDKASVKRGPWSPEEDAKLKDFIEKHGTGGNWIALPQKAGLKRCGKSCRLRWLNYLRPNLKHGEFSEDEDRIICSLYLTIGSRWSIIASQLPGRTDNDIKNYWNTKLKKKLLGVSPSSQRKPQQQQQQMQIIFPSSSSTVSQQGSYYSTTGLEPLPSTVSHQDIFAPFSLFHGQALQYPVKEGTNMIAFGGAEPSGSSSDGSCTHVTYAKEMTDLIYLCGGGGGVEAGNQKQPVLGVDKVWGEEAALEYNYEEIKQLLMGSNGWCTAAAPADHRSTAAAAAAAATGSGAGLVGEDPLGVWQGKLMYEF